MAVHSCHVARINNKSDHPSFTTAAKLRVNGIAVNASALCDTGAHCYLLVSQKKADEVRHRLKGKYKKLKEPTQLEDFAHAKRYDITRVLIVDFEINGRIFPRSRFLVSPCVDDILIGNYWFAEHDVLLRCRTNTIIWPDNKPATAQFSKAMVLPVNSNKNISPSRQKDADKRDERLELMHQQNDEERLKWVRNNPWREPKTPPKILKRPVEAAKMPLHIPFDTEKTKQEIEDIRMIEALELKMNNDPRRDRWDSLPLPKEAITLHDVEPTDEPRKFGICSMKFAPPSQEPIEFPKGEDPEHVRKVRAALPPQLQHLAGFFSKKASETLPKSKPGTDVVLRLKKPLEGRPPMYRTPVEFIPLEQETIDDLLRIGFIESCMDPNAAPTLFVPKPHSEHRRFCIDYRWINAFLEQSLCIPPDLAGTLFNCRNARFFSKLDIIRAFNRLLLSVESRPLTAFRTRQGTFRWKVLPFGLQVGPAWWQRYINDQLRELLDRCASAFFDDVLTWTETDNIDEHYTMVETVIRKLAAADLQGDIKKSQFAVKEVEYLGVVLMAGKGIKIDPKKIEAIQAWEVKNLTSKTAVKSFLGLCNYVRMFCFHTSEVAEPLNRLLKKDVPFVIGPEQEKSLEEMKTLVTSAPVMAFFNPGHETRVETDASRNATGGAVFQRPSPEEDWKPVGYFSKTMTPAERAYPIQDRELLAVVQLLEHYTPELLGSRFDVVTDHEALTHFATKHKLSSRQVRWAHFLSNFYITFRYRRGVENVVGDTLSRKTAEMPTVKEREAEERTFAMIPPETIAGPVDSLLPQQISNIKANEKPIVTTEPLLTEHGADLVDSILKENERQGLGENNGRTIVPAKSIDGRFLQTELITEFHTPKIFAHQGGNKLDRAIRREYYWPGMSKDIRRYVKNCHECSRNKTRHDKTPGLLKPLPVPEFVWDQVVVDGKDMPRSRRGHDYIWLFADKLSRIRATLTGRKVDSAETLASRYYQQLYRFFGMPTSWLTDNGSQFVSQFVDEINKLTGTKHRKGSTYHAQTQGAVERINADVDEKLRFFVDKYQDDWDDHTPALDFAHNSSWHSSIERSPLSLILGREPRTPLSLPLPPITKMTPPRERAAELMKIVKDVQDGAKLAAKQAQERQQVQANKKRRQVDWNVGDKVFVLKKGFSTDAPTTRLDSQWVGPYVILEMKGSSYKVDVPNFKGSNVFHADRLRKAGNDALPGQHNAPPPPEEIDGEPEFAVEKILASRIHRNKFQYQASWVGSDPDDTWYPARNFKNAPAKLDEYHERHPEAAGPPVNLKAWLRAAADDEFAPEDDMDDMAEKAATVKRRLRRHV